MYKKVNESITELRKICQNTRNNFDKRLFRNNYHLLSIYVTKWAIQLGLSANQMSLISLLFGIIAGLLLIQNNSWIFSLGILFFHIYAIFDFSDGEIARYKKETSLKGAFLDEISGDFVCYFLISCISFGIYNVTHHVWIFIFGFIFVIAMSIKQAATSRWIVLTFSKGKEKQIKKKNLKVERFGSLPTLLKYLKNILNIFILPNIMNAMLIASLMDALYFKNHFLELYGFCWRELVYLFYSISILIITIFKLIYIFYKGKILKMGSFFLNI